MHWLTIDASRWISVNRWPNFGTSTINASEGHTHLHHHLQQHEVELLLEDLRRRPTTTTAMTLAVAGAVVTTTRTEEGDADRKTLQTDSNRGRRKLLLLRRGGTADHATCHPATSLGGSELGAGKGAAVTGLTVTCTEKATETTTTRGRGATNATMAQRRRSGGAGMDVTAATTVAGEGTMTKISGKRLKIGATGKSVVIAVTRTTTSTASGGEMRRQTMTSTGGAKTATTTTTTTANHPFAVDKRRIRATSPTGDRSTRMRTKWTIGGAATRTKGLQGMDTMTHSGIETMTSPHTSMRPHALPGMVAPQETPAATTLKTTTTVRASMARARLLRTVVEERMTS